MAAAAGPEFVEGWLVAQVLGEGAYGEVRLLVHARSGAAVALKAVRAEGAREAALHRALRHPHVLRCLGERAHLGLHYVFLEYAQGGELFDRIEPDVGMAEDAARRYWRQLLGGLQYLHGRGVAHRDIKPENLLLDHRDQLKISDFGMATLFRHGTRERLLSRVCGTLPYAAPEVLTSAQRPYRAPPADLWSAALVLLAMLAGGEPGRAWRSQPAGGTGAADRVHCAAADGAPPDELSAADMDALLWHSQPAHADDLLLATQHDGHTPPSVLQRLVRRMTRVELPCAPAAALRALAAAAARLGYTARPMHAPHLMAIECDAEVRMRAWAVPAGSGTLLEVRRSRGCGLQFKRRYLRLRRALRPDVDMDVDVDVQPAATVL